jgi:carbon storage regulator
MLPATQGPAGKETTMLVLSRRINEKIVLPDLDICVHVLEIKGDRVRLGFEAPASVSILRGELCNAEPAAPADAAANDASGQPAEKIDPAPPLLRRPCSASLRSAMASRR